MRQLAALFVISLLSVTNAHAGDDFGMWGAVQGEKDINDRWSVGAGVQFRGRDNLKSADRWSFGVEGNYRIVRWLKVTAGYTLLNDNHHREHDKGATYSNYWGIRHRFNVSFTGSVNWGKFTFSLRERWQYTYRPGTTGKLYDTATGEEIGEKEHGAKAKHAWRNRLQVKLKLNSMFRPFVNAESTVARELEKMRYQAGTELHLDKRNSFDVKYIYQHICGEDDDEPDRHIISIGYTHKF